MSFISRERELLRIRDLRIVVLARAASLLGDQLAMMALMLHIQDSDGAAWQISALLAAGLLPIVLLSPVVGLLVDRIDSTRLLVASSLLQAAACTALATTGSIAPILVFALLLGVGQAINGATWTALVPAVVGPARIGAASGLMQSAATVAGIAAPAAGGVLYSVAGFRLPIALDALSFLAITAAALALRTRRGTDSRGEQLHEPGRADRASEGIRFIAGDRVLAPMLTLLTVFILLVGVINVVEIFLIRGTLGASATWYGLIDATFAVGLVGGALAAGQLTNHSARAAGFAIACLVLAAGLIAIGLAPSVWWLIAPSIIGGVANGVFSVTASSTLMTRSPEPIRGRVAAAYSACASSGSIASLVLGGMLASALTPRTILVLAGVAGITAVLALSPRLLRAVSRVPTAESISV